MKFSSILFRIQPLLLLPAVMWLFTNAIVNTHYHYLPDGQVVSHAHPYNKAAGHGTPVKSHDHSKTQLILLSILDKTDVVVSGFFIPGPLFPGILCQNTILPSEAPCKIYYQVYNYHAPPPVWSV